MYFQNNPRDLQLHDRFCGHNPVEVWRNRPLKHKLKHRFNVCAAFVLGEVSIHSFWLGIRHPEYMVALALRRHVANISRGMIFVCPEALAMVEEMHRPSAANEQDRSQLIGRA
jgi:hypothetical protein